MNFIEELKYNKENYPVFTPDTPEKQEWLNEYHNLCNQYAMTVFNRFPNGDGFGYIEAAAKRLVENIDFDETDCVIHIGTEYILMIHEKYGDGSLELKTAMDGALAYTSKHINE